MLLRRQESTLHCPQWWLEVGRGETPHLCRMGKESGVFCSDRPRGGGATLFLQRRLDQNPAHRLHRARVPPHHRCGGVGVHVRALPTGEESRLITQGKSWNSGFCSRLSRKGELSDYRDVAGRGLTKARTGRGHTSLPLQESGGSLSSSPIPAGEGRTLLETEMKERVPPADPQLQYPPGEGWL